MKKGIVVTPTGVITLTEDRVWNYLKEHPGFNSPTEIGRALNIRGSWSSWACRRCKRLVVEGVVKRNDKGWYAEIPEGEIE